MTADAHGAQSCLGCGLRASSTRVAQTAWDHNETQRRQREQAFTDLNQYMARLVERHCKQPGDDLLSGLATDTSPDGRMEDPYLVATASLLLVAGHETTVNAAAVPGAPRTPAQRPRPDPIHRRGTPAL